MVFSQRDLRLLNWRLLLSIGVIAAVGLIGGCADTGTRPITSAPGNPAARLAASGNYSAAAVEYLRQAKASDATRANDYLIQAAHYYARDNQAAKAESVYSHIPPNTLTAPQRVSYNILQAHLALLRGKPQQALDKINAQRAIPASSATWAWEIRADASAALGDGIANLRARIELDRLLWSGARQSANQEALWRALQGLSDAQLTDLQAPGNGAALAGWASLAFTYRNAPADPLALQQALNAWQAQHATHPAAKGFAQGLAARGAQLILQPRQIAVLLPTSGRYAGPAAAVRDGILAAWYAQAVESRPMLRFYSVPEAGAQAATVYRSAIANGADMVIGPLRKPAVAAVVGSGAPTVPTLALNRLVQAAPKAAATPGAPVLVPASAPAQLYQFGLAPEDDAASAADQAAKDGLHQAIALLPVGAKGERIQSAFADAMEQNEGVLLETQFYDTSNESPFSDPIKRSLNLDASSSRRRKLESLLGENLEFEPQPRGDVDFVFLYARAGDARQIIPQLAFFGADRLPIYATADAFDGRPNRDLRGLVFPIPPWQATPDAELSATRQLLQNYRGDSFTAFDRLYALGIDAYRLTPHLRRLREFSNETINGASGTLRVDSNGLVHRAPLWARVHGGQVDVYTATVVAVDPMAADATAAMDPGTADDTTNQGLDGTPLPPPKPIRVLDDPAGGNSAAAMPDTATATADHEPGQ